MKIKHFSLILFLLFFQFYFSQNEIIEEVEDITSDTLYDNQTYPYNEEDTIDVKIKNYDYQPNSRYFKEKFQEKYKKEKAFDYNEKVYPKSNYDLSFLSGIGNIFMYASLLVFISILVYIVYLFFVNKEVKLNKQYKKVYSETEELIENEDDIHQNKFDILIKNYENANEFRMAFRYQYLWIIQLLSNKKVIQWQKKKTNSDYLAELEGTSHEFIFKDLSYIFDYVWYGEFEITKEQYEIIIIQCINFRKRI